MTLTTQTVSAVASPQPSVVEYATSRPRVLGWVRSAAILDGDWGTSIAYVLGIGFALAGNSSFWHLMAMLALTAIVAVNYITICRLYPNGGGVYSSVKGRSQTLAVVGALLLGANYVITMALSVLEACHYFALQHPEVWAIAIILMVAVLNWYGPRKAGGLAIIISALTVITLITVIVASAPTAIQHARIDPIHDGVFRNWGIFVGIILSISGIESISNMTGLMKDPVRDSRKAILSVLSKVVLATVFLGFAMHAIPGLEGHTEDMLRFLGEYYVHEWFGWAIAVALGFLLISAGNTALNALISVQFMMAVDQELPASLRKLNRYGVPTIPLIVATLAPILVLIVTSDLMALAQLYAIGVVGAILINIASTGTDRALKIPRLTRLMMIVSALVLFFVELSIVIEKHQATIFAVLVLAVGLAARQIARRRPTPAAVLAEAIPAVAPRGRRARKAPAAKFLVALKGMDERLLRFATDEAKTRNAMLFVLRVKEIAVGDLPERLQLSANGEEKKIAELVAQGDVDYQLISIPSNEVGYTIAEHAAMFGVDRVILGAPSRNLVEKVLKGSTIRSVGSLLPEEIQLVIFGG
ncbi:MAG TPA: universal stress protein [Bacteroidota bacterium]|nr:universal stress protein [Bacteroidota bacterium]